MNLRISAAALALLVLLASAAQGQVMADKARQKRLDGISRVVDAPPPDMDRILAGSKNPFLSNAPATPAAGTATSSGPALDPAKPTTLLDAAADIMHPTGVLTSGDGRRFLSWADGSLYEVGKPFTIKLPAPIGDCEILIETADSTHYVLRKGDVTIIRYFEETDTAGGKATESR